MTLDELQTYLEIGGRRDVIAASLVFIHGYSDDQADEWIAEQPQKIDQPQRAAGKVTPDRRSTTVTGEPLTHQRPPR